MMNAHKVAIGSITLLTHRHPRSEKRHFPLVSWTGVHDAGNGNLIWRPARFVFAAFSKWWIPNDPQVTMGFNTKMIQNGLMTWMIWGIAEF